MAETESRIVIQAEDRTAAAFRSVGRSLNDLGRQFSAVLGPIAALGGVAGLAGVVKSALAAGDELAKLAQKTGASVEALSKYQYGAQLAGVSTDELRTGLQQLQKNMGDALANPTAIAARTFRSLGLSVVDARGQLRSTDAVLEDLARTFAAAPDGPAKTAAAMSLLGRSGAELIPFLNSLRETSAEAERLGLVVSTDFARKAEAFNDNLSRMAETGKRFGITIANAVLPALDELVQRFNVMIGAQESLSLDLLQKQRAKLGLEYSLLRNAGLGEASLRLTLLRKEIDAVDEQIIAANRRLAALQQAQAAAGTGKPLQLPTADKALGRGAASGLEEAFRAEAEISAGQTAAGIALMAEQVVAEYESLGEKLAAARAAQLEGDVQQLAESLLTETELLNAKYAQDLQTLYDARQAEHFTELQFAQAREALEQQHQARLINIEKNKNAVVRSMQFAAFQNAAGLLQAFAGESKAAAIAVIAINKGLAIAQTIISTQAAIMRAYAELGPIAGSAMAAKIALLGKISVAIIAATGLVEAAQVGHGGAELGSPANPVNVTPHGREISTDVPAAAGPAPLAVIVNLDGRPILETVQRASRDGRLVINAHAVR